MIGTEELSGWDDYPFETHRQPCTDQEGNEAGIERQVSPRNSHCGTIETGRTGLHKHGLLRVKTRQLALADANTRDVALSRTLMAAILVKAQHLEQPDGVEAAAAQFQIYL